MMQNWLKENSIGSINLELLRKMGGMPWIWRMTCIKQFTSVNCLMYGGKANKHMFGGVTIPPLNPKVLLASPICLVYSKTHLSVRILVYQNISHKIKSNIRDHKTQNLMGVNIILTRASSKFFPKNFQFTKKEVPIPIKTLGECQIFLKKYQNPF